MTRISAGDLAFLLGAGDPPGVDDPPGTEPTGPGNPSDIGAASGVPAYRRLADGIRDLVLIGTLAVPCRLPAERELVAALGLSRTTVSAAYSRLRTDGFLLSRQGAGSWTALPPGHPPRAGIPHGPDDRVEYDLSVAAWPGDADRIFAALDVARGLLPLHLRRHGYDGRGLAVLREAVAELYTRRGLPTGADQILITQGAQAAVDLIARHTLSGTDTALVETPTYPHCLRSLSSRVGRLVTVPVTAAGWDVDVAEEIFERTRPRLAFLTPAYNNPTGALMDDAARIRLAAAAERAGTILVLDEALADLGLDSDVVPDPFATRVGPDAIAVSVGSLSKVHWGGLRVGWLRSSVGFVAALSADRAVADIGSPIIDQLVALPLLEQHEQMAAQRRAELRPAYHALAEALASDLPDWSHVPPVGGTAAWIDIGAPLSTRLAVAAAEQGVRLTPGPRFGPGGVFERHIRIPFVLPPADMRATIARLATIVAGLGPASHAADHDAVV